MVIVFLLLKLIRQTSLHLELGKAISVLEIKYAEQFNIMLYGEYQVSTDDECWDIVWKFRRYQLSTIMKTIIDEATSSGARNGKLSLQLQLQTLLGL